MIKLLKQRFGFATNSSSSHSIVYLRDGHEYTDSVEDGPGNGDFGWNFWTAASSEAKLRYWSVQLRDNLRQMNRGGTLPQEYYAVLAEALSGHRAYGDIDHQSIISLPRKHGERTLDMEFYHQLVTALDDARIVIVGGNDNVSTSHPAVEIGSCIRYGLPMDQDVDPAHDTPYRYAAKRRCLVSRYDEERDEWVIFNQYTGQKVRLSFSNFKNEVSHNHYSPDFIRYYAPAGFPELVDIKITDYCDRGCVWCYQGSGRRGKHANWRDLSHIAEVLSAAGVLEVAIGGGEPTAHPDFGRVLESFRLQDIVPNFSTGSLDWMDDPKIVEPVVQQVGGWAYTVRSVKEVDALLERLKDRKDFCTDRKYMSFRYDMDKPVVSVHIVMGTMERKEFRAILEKCAAYEMTTTLLGFKTAGRAKGLTPKAYPWLFEEIADMHKRGFHWNISVDTSIVQQFPNDMPKSPLTYDRYEALRSMYVDAVTGCTAMDSYSAKQHQFPYAHKYDSEWLWKRLRDRSLSSEDWNAASHKIYARSKELEEKHAAKAVALLTKRFRQYRDAQLKKAERSERE